MADCKFESCFRKKVFAILRLWLLLTSFNLLLIGGEKIRHHRHGGNDGGDYYRLQLEKSQIDDTTESPLLGCPNCFYKTNRVLKSQTDGIRLEAIKRQILSKLGLRQKPNITHSLPRELILETISRAEDGEVISSNFNLDEDDISTTSARTSHFDNVDVDDFYGRTSEIISFGEGFTVNGNRFLDFRITAEPGQSMQELRVRAASLWLKADLRKRPLSSCQQFLWAFRVKEMPTFSNKLQIEEDFGTRQEIDSKNSGWQKLNLTDTVRSWLAEGDTDRLRILIDCSCSCPSVHLHLSDTGTETRANPNRPFLVIYTDPNISKRVRRRALDCSPDSGNQCCKQRFYVSFKELGWDDWVIAPQGYYANYCRGDCGHHRTPDTYVTYHTHVIEEMRKAQHLSGMQPCCAPLKFSSMSLIYFGPESNIIKRDLPKMVVDECGCP
ncbi:hypothetical protein RI129_013197 [Pyrocoelia pectoralis]|uniref:TGF-beta family profile domain-containing protein n=1 Tax=Pyrocoelia pectoralis TaxID=417401 RepID=A0AAN7ZD23_9COLE